jgi:hypothetical protein
MRDRQKRYNERLINNIMRSENPEQMMRYFRYRKIIDDHGYITKSIIKKEFGVSDTTAKKYLSDLRNVSEKNKLGMYDLPHNTKLKMAVIEML